MGSTTANDGSFAHGLRDELTAGFTPATVASVSSKNDRGRELGAYAVITFGMVLAVYGTAAKSDGWRSKSVWFLPVLGVALTITALRVLRSLPADRVKPPIGLRILAILVSVTVGAVALYLLSPGLKGLALHDRELPGLTIGLPEGDEEPDPQNAAKVLITLGSRQDVFVGALWQVNTFDDANARGIADSAAANVGARAEPWSDAELVVGDGVPHRSFRIDAQGVDMSITVFGCGARIFAVLVGGNGMPVLARRVLATVRCHPTRS